MTQRPRRHADTVAVLDFETTGLSPTYGDRAIEIGAVLIEEGRITDRFQDLMNPGFRIDAFIENYKLVFHELRRKANWTFMPTGVFYVCA